MAWALEWEGGGGDKILTEVLGKPIFAYAIEAFIKSEVVDRLVLIYRDLIQKEFIEEWISDNVSNPLPIVWAQGGARRQDSVLIGLRALPAQTDFVFIHDIARPLIQPVTIRKINHFLLAEGGGGGTALAHPVTDTVKQTFAGAPKVLHDLNRETLWAMETPQAFKHSVALGAYEEVERRKIEVTDDAAAVSLLNHPITIIENHLPNPKITVQHDIDYVEFLLTQKSHASL